MSTMIEKRAVSGFPVSIGTALALESMFDPVQKPYDEARELPNMIDLSTYTTVMINVNTLIRNLIAALPSEEVMSYTVDEYKEVLLDEITYLEGLFGLLDTEVKMYTNDYSYAFAGIPQERIRTANTARQQFIEQVTLALENDMKLVDDVISFKGELKPILPDVGSNMKILLISHIPWDLFSYRNFAKFDLLETYTGKLKERKDWFTKYYEVPNTDLSFLPFSKKLLPVLGDHVMFKPDNINYRKRLIAYLSERLVTPITNDGTLSIFMTKVRKDLK